MGGEKEKERLLAVSLDEGDGFFAEEVGEVVRRGQRLPADILTENFLVLGGSQMRQNLWWALNAREGMKLAGFQERAALRLSAATDDGGTIITAGTGSGKTIAFYLAHNMLWGDGVRHQAGFIGFLNDKGKIQPGGDGWFYSHNFDQRLILANGDFCALAHGDAYPRALGFSRWPGTGGKAVANQTYHDIPGESGDNTTNCQTGGLIALPNRKFAVVFASSNGREAHDVCVKILDENGKTTREQWLTNDKKGQSCSYPRIARDGDNIFVAWHEGPNMQQVVLNTSLETIVPRSSTSDVRLSPYDDLHTLDNGTIAWAVPVEGNKVRVHRIESRMLDHLPGEKHVYLRWQELEQALQAMLADLDIEPGNNESSNGPDLSPLRKAGMPVLSPQQDGTLYFDFHHTANDTLDKVNKDDLDQNVGVYAALTWIAANMEGDFGRLPVENDETAIPESAIQR